MILLIQEDRQVIHFTNTNIKDGIRKSMQSLYYLLGYDCHCFCFTWLRLSLSLFYLVTIVIVFEEKISKSKEKIFKSGIYRNL